MPDESGPPAEALPALIDRYRLLRRVGRGGSSDVFEAEHVQTGRRVALKLLRRELAGDPRVVERLRREARTAASIGHRNIVHVEDFGTTADGAVYLVMEWLEGETLADRIERGPMPQPAALDLAAQIGAGLAAAHAVGVIHRDVKPANVFLVPQPGGGDLAKLLDFGIAKLALSESRLTRTGTFLGTPDYVAPEQALGEEVDGRADLYGFGVLLYQLLTGTLPFTGETFMAVLHRHATQVPEPPSRRAPRRGITPALEALVLRCLAKRREDRFATAGELLAALESARRSPAAPLAPRRAGAVESPPGSSAHDPAAPPAPVAAARAQAAPAQAAPAAVPGAAASAAPRRIPTPAALSDLAPTPRFLSPDAAPDDSIDLPRRRRAGVWLSLLLLAVGGAGVGAVLLVAADGPGVDETGAGVRVPDEAGPAGPAPASGTIAAVLGPDAGPATPPTAEPRDVWKFPGKAAGFDYTVWISPRAIRPRAPFLLDVEILPGRELARSWKPSDLRARLTFVHYRRHHIELRGEFPIGDSDRVSSSLTLPRAGKHHVELVLHAGDSELGRAKFDLCVGADPAGPRAARERACPHMQPTALDLRRR